MRRSLLISSAGLLTVFLCGQGGPVGLPSVPTLAALKATPVTQHKYIQRLGFNAPGDGGEATYNSSNSPCTLNTGNGDNGSQVKPNIGSGCWIATFPVSGVDIRVFGGAGDNTTDNTTPLLAALTAQSYATTDVSILFPPGKFKFLGNVAYTIPTGAHVTIAGSGSDGTELTWPSTGGGISLTYTNDTNTVDISGLTCSTGAVNGGTCLTLTQTLTTLPDITPPPSTINRFVCRGADGYRQTDYWTTCVDVVGVWNVNFMQDYFGGDTGFHGTGIKLRGGTVDRIGAVYNVAQSTFNWTAIGISHGTYIQGVTVHTSSFVGTNIGYSQPSGTGSSQLMITNSEFDIQGAGGKALDLTNAFGLMLTSNQITVETANNIGVNLTSIGDFVISNNLFLMIASLANTTAIQINSETADGVTPKGVIENNYFKNYQVAVFYATAGTYYDIIKDNRYRVFVAGIGAVASVFLLDADAPLGFGIVVPCSPDFRGRTQDFTDSNTNTLGATIAAGGANWVRGICNGSAWTVMGK